MGCDTLCNRIRFIKNDSTLKCISSYIFYETAMLNMVYNIYGNNEIVRGIIWRFIPIRLTVPKNAQPNRYNKKTLYRGGPLKCHYQI